jgi:Domain of unknown function (DUF222)
MSYRWLLRGPTRLFSIEHMFEPAEVRDAMAEWVADLEPAVSSGEQARSLLDVMSDLKRLAGAAETLLAARVAETEAWRDGSDRSAAHWLGRRIGTSVAEARAKLETAERLGELPATSVAFRAGRLSDQQAREVVAGAVADPRAEQALLDVAADDSLKELRDESRRAQAVDDEEGRQRGIHQRRSLRVRVDSDGTWCLTFRGTAFAGAKIQAALRPFTDAAFKQARREDRRESLAAYAADGLAAMAEAAASGEGGVPAKSNVKIIIRLDATALCRGEVGAGEVCDIPGVGPVPVSAVRDLLGEAALAVVITDGVDVKTVAHLKRRTTAHQRTALEFWGIRCDVKGCDSTDFVDVHHTFEWARGRRTRLDELRTPCKFHHRKEHQGWKPTDDQIRSRGRRPVNDTRLPLSA